MESSNSSDIVDPYPSYSSNDEDEEELEEIQKEQDEKEWTALFQIAGKLILMYYEKYLYKEPCRTSSRSGNVFIQEILRGNETRFYENFRLRKSVFVDLSNDLTEKYGLKPTRGMSIHEMLGMFLITCVHGAGNRLIQEIFQHSGETIHIHFHSILKAICEIARDIIRPHQNYNDGAGAHKPCNGRYLPFFRDCIGALDGTHVKARLPQGAAHDSRIFGEALRRPELNFPHPIGNKNYLVDAGYPHMKGYMAPYKGDNLRYHLAKFRRGATRQLREPRERIEKFNYLHSSCRNIVERTFGVWKARWSILRDMAFYHIDTQRSIVLDTMAIHNYIRKKCNMDDAFRATENGRYVPSIDPDIGTSLRANNNINTKNMEEQSDLVWMGLHDLIANEICEA
ncbi:PREDICTED: uncharacterized protein LOC109227603 [Nicotiana attenuata]|uniref:uncharacterized protein LOC109227603 n=1 Tax=Nicotiana attenuata TaxID=49451 RepID=UPI00090546BF|nr:PREDICTED: uncharacterized protein LOC109227603 [Nicotiana attenuata]